jgi:LuxR family maltose regulon positive regulatory protein
VERSQLVDRLVGVSGGSVALLVAPAGYGKSALLAQWAGAETRRVVGVRMARGEEVTYALARALAPLDAGVHTTLAETGNSRSQRSAAALMRALSGALERPGFQCVLMLDDVHDLEDHTALADLVEQAAPGVVIALASRSEPDLPIARLRAERRLLELRAPELALSGAEVTRVAAGIGLDLDEQGLETLTRRTEGWPAGVQLAGVALRDGAQPQRSIERFGGDDRVVADYIRQEVLARLTPDQLTFLVRSSILERLSGALCDHVLQRRRSSEMLRELSRANVLVFPLDRVDREYRCHPLLSQTLRAELRLEPELEVELRTRATEWYEANGDRGRAIDQAIEAGDLGAAGRLLWSEAPSLLGYGHCPTLIRHLRRFTSEQLGSSASLALTAASAHLALGDRALVEHWTAAAAEMLPTGDSGGSLAGGMLAMRAAVSEEGLAATRDMAARAYELSPEPSPWRALACLVEGATRHLTGDSETARVRLEEGARRGAAQAPAIQVLCLSQLALLAIGEDHWDAAELLATRAHAQIERVGIGDYPTTALTFAVSAAIRARLGQLDACDRDARQAGKLLQQLGSFTPWFTAECRIALAWAAARLSEQRLARRLLDEAEYELRMIPEATVANEWLEACKQQLESVAGARSTDAEPLTKAELRVLQYLPTHLSFLEIAEHLYVSTNTVKTHARAVYRKLAASSRSEAVMHAREAGLLEGTA